MENELNGEEIVKDVRPPDTKHLSPRNLKRIEMSPKVIRDNIKGCETLKGQTEKKTNINKYQKKYR